MDEQRERDSILQESMRLCEHLARVWSVSLPQRELKDPNNLTPEEEVYINRGVSQLGQIFTLHGFLVAIMDSYFQLLREPERAGEIGREGLQNLHDFLKELTGLLEEEYRWCK